MNFFNNKSWFFNLLAVASLTIMMSYFVVNKNFSAESEPVQFVNLTDADIDKILNIKAEMQEAKIQAD